MPLVIITGLPSSGKTHRARQILANFQSRIASASDSSLSHIPNNVTVQYLASSHALLDSDQSSSEDSRSVDPSENPRDLIYNTAREEKTARAEEFSTTKKALSKNNVVITDAPNYIKGFRYQLWCEAKAVGTRSVVVHVAAREDECITWNRERIEAWGWEELLKEKEENIPAISGPKIGKDIQGELQPESHTAIYGDKMTDETIRGTTRSRSSSMGGASDIEEDDRRKDLTETMTLKSLYISNRRSDAGTDGDGQTDGHASRVAGDASGAILVQEPAVAVSTQLPSPKSSLPYSQATLRSLAMRYEPPSPFTRWDTPLFTVPTSDPHPPYQEIWDAIFPRPSKPTKRIISQLRPGDAVGSKAEEVRRHAATVLPKATSADALQILESATADVVKILLATARERDVANGEGGQLVFPVPDPKSKNDTHVEVEIPLNTMLNQPALQRLRRKYTQIQRGGIAHGQNHTSGRNDVVKDFCKFLQTEWNTD